MLNLRTLTLISGLAVLLPGAAQAKNFGRKGSGPSGSNSTSRSSGNGSHNAAPANTPHQAQNGGRGRGGPNGYRNDGGYSRGYSRGGGGYAYSSGYYSPGYGYYGWGVHPWGYYGYGYYPYYGGPVIAEEVAVEPPQITSSLMLGGLVTHDGSGLDLRGNVDGRQLGINFDMVTLPTVSAQNTVTLMPLMSAHLTYSAYSDLHTRLRLEGGVSGIAAPDVTYIGPDVGISAQVALLGPLGLEGAVHWTPLPANIIDADAGVALHFGNLGIRGGWRVLRLDDHRVNDQGGVDVLSGPSLSIGLVL